MGNVHGADRRVHTWEAFKEKLFVESKKLGTCVAAEAYLMGCTVFLHLKSLGLLHGADHRVHAWEAIKEKLFGESKIPRICVAGAGGLMGSVICRCLKSQGYYVIACDWMKDELVAKHKYWDEYHVTDPTDARFMDKCLEVTRGVDLVFNFATGGGLGFGEYHLSATKERDTTIGYSMAEAARINGVRRFFHASLVCVWLAERQYCIDFEESDTEKLCKRYYEDFGFECRIGRFFCIYDPLGAWEGGRGEARAAGGEPSISTGKFGVGDGMHPIIDGYVKKLLSLMESDCHEPVHIGSLNMRELAIMGSDETVSEN